LAVAYFNAGLYEKARTTLTEVLKKYPDYDATSLDLVLKEKGY